MDIANAPDLTSLDKSLLTPFRALQILRVNLPSDKLIEAPALSSAAVSEKIRVQIYFCTLSLFQSSSLFHQIGEPMKLGCNIFDKQVVKKIGSQHKPAPLPGNAWVILPI